MDDDGKKHSDQFDAALPLPIDDTKNHGSAQINHAKPNTDEPNAAADLIRKRVQAAYKEEPGATTEAEDIKKLGESIERSKHQEFIYELTSSGKPLHEINTAWHEYYAALPEEEKHEVWQEFYNTHAQASQFSASIPNLAPPSHVLGDEDFFAKYASRPASAPAEPLKQIRHRLKIAKPVAAQKKASPYHSLAFGLSIGFIVLFLYMFTFFNERFIAPFIQPSRNVATAPIIAGSAVGSNPEIIIPKINVEIPVDYSLTTNDDNAIENALENGVVHYANTAMPGQDGNLVIVGHSSNNIFNPGKYKFAFVLLSRLDSGDTFYLQKDGKRYTYQVYKKEIVNPNSVEVLGPQDKPATATLITCDPPGTSRNRLVVIGTQIDPSPTANLAQAPSYKNSASIIPGNSPTLWSRLVKWLES